MTVAPAGKLRERSRPTNPAMAMAPTSEKNGTRLQPVVGSLWHHLYGPDTQHVLHHVTVAMPGATGAALGLPENGNANGAWVMDAGTSSAHIMLPPQE